MVILAVPLPPALHTQNQIETLCIPTIHAKQLGNNDCVLLLHIHYTIFVYTSGNLSGTILAIISPVLASLPQTT